jgi:hypothetical protein
MSFGGDRPTLGKSLTTMADGRLLGYCDAQEDGGAGIVYSYNFLLEGTPEGPFEPQIEGDALTPLSLNFNGFTLVDLASLSVLQNQKPGELFLLYPNPATAEVYFNKTGQAEVHNSLGQRFYSGQVSAEGLDISQWPGGVYVVGVVDSQTGQRLFGRFIKP